MTKPTKQERIKQRLAELEAMDLATLKTAPW